MARFSIILLQLYHLVVICNAMNLSLLKTEYIPFKSTLCLVQIFFIPICRSRIYCFGPSFFCCLTSSCLLSCGSKIFPLLMTPRPIPPPFLPSCHLSPYLITYTRILGSLNLGFTSRYPDKSHLVSFRFRFTITPRRVLGPPTCNLVPSFFLTSYPYRWIFAVRACRSTRYTLLQLRCLLFSVFGHCPIFQFLLSFLFVQEKSYSLFHAVSLSLTCSSVQSLSRKSSFLDKLLASMSFLSRILFLFGLSQRYWL